MRTKIFIIFIILFSLSLFFIFKDAFGQSASSDAIAIRVISNPEHYSALRWYEEQGFSGSPQSLVVDGYNAVRDGRTVYVAAANIDDHNTDDISDDNLYTVIYLISYNKEAEQETIDIFSQILKHWKFNTNIITTGICEDADSVCVLDSDCPQGKLCFSQKAKIIRDVRRLADLADIKTVLDDYERQYKKFPVLTSGSYLPHKSLSVWPSWNNSLSRDLGIVLPIDPINRLGDCGDSRFNPITCWDEKAQEFADSNPADPAFNLPNGSQVYIYTVSDDGKNYNVCGVMETNYANEGDGGNCSDLNSLGGSANIIGVENDINGNNSPQFGLINLPIAYSGEEYEGFIEAFDPDGDVLTWTIDTSSSTWEMWSSPPEMNNTILPKQKEIYAQQTGVAGTYSFSVSIDDGRGEPNSIITRNFDIIVDNLPPSINIQNIVYEASSTNPLDVSFFIQDNLSNYPLSYSLTGNIPPNITDNFYQSGNFYNLDFSGIIDKNVNPIPETTIYDYILAITDFFGDVNEHNFSITVINNPPIIITPLTCPDNVRINNFYGPCQIISSDPEHNIVYYDFSGLPLGIVSNANGVLSGTPTEEGSYTISITPYDEYGATGTTVNLPLSVNTYCGDGIVQTPNAEGLGGPDNNGFEQCDCDLDGNCSNVANSPANSSQSVQYECSGTCADLNTDCAGACQSGGGWNGDGIIQSEYGEECDDGITDNTIKCNVLSSSGLLDLDDSPLDCDNFDNNLRTEQEISDLYDELCIDAHIECLGDPLFAYLGAGCYIDDDNNGCNKGINKCLSVEGTPQIVCYQDSSWGTISDYCCMGDPAGLAALPEVDIVDIDLVGSGTEDDPYTYRTCDQICRDWGMQQGKQMICVGVGLNDGAGTHDECVAPLHNSGNNCSLVSNQVSVNCRTLMFGTNGGPFSTRNECEAPFLTGSTWTQKPCVYLEIGDTLPIGISSTLTINSNGWYRMRYNTSAGSFCYEGIKGYHAATASCYCKSLP